MVPDTLQVSKTRSLRHAAVMTFIKKFTTKLNNERILKTDQNYRQLAIIPKTLTTGITASAHKTLCINVQLA